MQSTKSQGRMTLFLLASVPTLSGCGAAAGINIPDSLKAECVSTVDVSNATTVGDLGQAIVQGDADLRVCNIQKQAVIVIAESQNRRWFEFWR